MQDNNQQPQPIQQPQPQPMTSPQPTSSVQFAQQPQALSATPVAPQVDPRYHGAGMFQRRIGRLGFFLGHVYILLFFVAPILLYAAVSFATNSIEGGSGGSNPILNIILFLWGAVGLIFLIPVIVSIYVRRLHDIGQTGLLTLLAFIPFASIIFYLYLQFVPGNESANQYGPRVNDNRPLVALGLAKPRQ